MDKSKELANLIPAFDKTKVIGFDPSVKNPAVVVCDLNEKGFVDNWVRLNVSKEPGMIVELNKNPTLPSVDDLLNKPWVECLINGKKPASLYGVDLLNGPHVGLFPSIKNSYVSVEQLHQANKHYPPINIGAIGHIQYPDIGDFFAPDLDFYKQNIKVFVNYTGNRLGPEPVVLKYSKQSNHYSSVELSVSGMIVWTTPNNFTFYNSIIPSKRYIREMFFWSVNFKGHTPPPKPESVTPYIPKYQERFYVPGDRNRGLINLRNLISTQS